MKRIIVAAIVIVIAMSATSQARENREKRELRDTSKVHFSVSARGGLFFPSDSDFRKIYGKYTNDIYTLELGWYPFKNLYVSGMAGFYYEPANTIGSVTLTTSDEDLYMSLLPLELGLGYRFNFAKNQIVVPYLHGGYDFFYYSEDADPGDVQDGWKTGPSGALGLLVLLDKIEPSAAWSLYRGFKIDNSYFDIGGKYLNVGSSGGVNFIGPYFYAGLTFEF